MGAAVWWELLILYLLLQVPLGIFVGKCINDPTDETEIADPTGKAMTLSEIYRARAATLAEDAESASTPVFKERFKSMALAYERLAEKYARRVRLHEKKAPAGRERRRTG